MLVLRIKGIPNQTMSNARAAKVSSEFHGNAAPDKPGGGMISEEALAEKKDIDAAPTEAAGGEDHAVAIEPAGPSGVAKVFPSSRHFPRLHHLCKR